MNWRTTPSLVLAGAVAVCGCDSVVPYVGCPDPAWWELAGVGGVDLCPGRVTLPVIEVPAGDSRTVDLTSYSLTAVPDLVLFDGGGPFGPSVDIDGVPPARRFSPPWLPGPVDLVAKGAVVLVWTPPIEAPKALRITTQTEPRFPTAIDVFSASFINEACEAAHPIPACEAPGYPTADPSSLSGSPAHDE